MGRGGLNRNTFYGKNRYSYGNRMLENRKRYSNPFNRSAPPSGNFHREFDVNRNNRRNVNTTPNYHNRKWNRSLPQRSYNKPNFSSTPPKRDYGRNAMSDSRLPPPHRMDSLYMPNKTYFHHSSPGSYSPNKAPSSYSPNKASNLYSPNKTPNSYSPNKTPNLFSSNKTPNSYSPNKAESPYSPNNTPYNPNKSTVWYSASEGRNSCGSRSNFSRKRLISEMDASTQLSDTESTPEKRFNPSPRQIGSPSFRSSPANYENKRSPFRRKKLIDEMDRDRVIAAYAPDTNESIHNKENLVDKRTVPHLIGFPNQGNTCYLNATLQALFGLPPFTSELSDVFNKVAANTVCKNVSGLFNARSRGNKHYMSIALKRVKTSLGTIHESFNGARMQDAQEFLTHLLDSVKDDIDRCEKKTEEREESSENRRSENLSESPRKPLAEIPSSLPTTNTIEINPVTENFQLRIQESIHCTKCQESHTTTQDHISLFLNVPHKRFGEDDYRPSLQDALNLYLRPDNREIHCSKCGNQDHRVTTTLTRLPRILVLQLKRYNYASQSVKLQNFVKLPQYLNVNHFLNDEVEHPHRWCPTPESQSDEEPDDSTDFKTSDLGSSIEGQEENPVVLDDEERELQEALRISREEHAKREQDEESELEQAIKLSLAELPDTGDWDDTHDSSGFVEDECLDAGSMPCSYRLISIVSHRGKNANTGHYVADVYKLDEGEWYHYDDESVTKVAEQDVLGQARQRNGYIFFYMFKDTCEQLAAPKSS